MKHLVLALALGAASAACAAGPRIAVFHNHIVEMAKQRGVSVEQAVEAVKAWGVEGVDVFAAFDGGESERILAAGLKPAVYILSADFGRGDDAAAVEKAKAFLVRTGCGRLMLVPGYIPKGMTREAAWAAAKPRVAALVDWADAKGVAVGMEDFDSREIIVGSTAHLREAFREIPRLGHVLDTGNYAFWGESVEAALREFRERVMHVHVKHADAEPTRRAVRELVRTGYDGWLTIECFGSTNMWDDVRRAADGLRDVRGPTLRDRVRLSARRLEDARYSPERVFLTEAESGGWPGDTEGRTILALVLQNAALGEKPKHLDGILRALPAHLNAKGYMGPVREGVLDEQQLAGNGWLMRGLCEYALRERNPVLDAKPIVRSIARNLFLPGRGRYAAYPITPSARTVGGGASGSVTDETKDGWRLSSDIGCLFIGMDGLIQAQQVTGDADLKPVIEEMIARFLEIDLVAIKAQTHATLTALRGLLRYDARRFLPEVERRFALYVAHGMTDRYENYNWFDRFDTWTEPCAIVDSVLVAHELHRLTGKAAYADYERKFLAALCAHQRENGGFGLQKTFPKGEAHEPVEHAREAYWCCTMRGGAGLASVLLW